MRHAKAWLALGAASLFLVAACEADSGSLFSADGKPSDSEKKSPGAGGTDPEAADGTKGGANAVNAPGAPTATGVLLLHTASFPSFRLCFENMPAALPQPDATVMPEANVVGVEIGSVVRLDPLQAPGKVYVIDESRLRTTSTVDKPNTTPCGELIATGVDKTSRSLRANSDYFPAGEIKDPIGQSKVDVLSISGCASQALLDDLDAVTKTESGACGMGWDPTYGNLLAKVIDLDTSVIGPTDSTLPVQIYNLAAALQARGGRPSVDFHGAPTIQTLEVGAVFERGAQATLNVNQTNAGNYASYGFDVKVNDGIVTTQSLADVQQLSAPSELPTSYYRAASNYALLLLGDPAHTKTSPNYNPRRSLHLLAVPVIDPSKADAGADAATPTLGDDAGL